MTNEELLAMARSGLVREVAMQEDSSLSIETAIPMFGASWDKGTISTQDECYQLLLQLSKLKNPGDSVNLRKLSYDKSSHLFNEQRM